MRGFLHRLGTSIKELGERINSGFLKRTGLSIRDYSREMKGGIVR